MSTQSLGPYETTVFSSAAPTSPADQPVALDPANVESRSQQAYIVAGFCLPLVLIFVGLRLYAKLCILRSRTWDDYTCVVATLCTVVFIALSITGTSIGAICSMAAAYSLTVTVESSQNLRSWDPALYAFTREKFLRLSVLYWTLYEPFVFVIKLSLLLLYLQIFDSLRWLKVLVWGGIFVNGAFYFSAMIWILVACTPARGSNYLESFASPQCRKMTEMSLTVGIFGVVSDLYLLFIPIPAVLPLQLPIRQKVGVLTVFFTGLLACVCSVMSLVYRIRLNQNIGQSWDLIPLHMVTSIEMTAGVIVLCMPAVSAIIRRWHSPVRLHFTSYRQGFISLSSANKRHSDAETAATSRYSGHRYSNRHDYALRYVHRDHDGYEDEEIRLEHDDLV